MSKYIIDIEEKPLCVFDEDTQTYFPRLWRVKGFNSLVFDEEGLSRLEELNSDYINEHFGDLQDTAYQRGLDDAWEAARKIVLSPDEGGTSLLTIFAIFGVGSMQRVFRSYSASEAIAKLKAYEEKQADDKIEAGDEVKRKLASENDSRGIVTKEWGDIYYIMWSDGSSGKWYKDHIVKTGRHFDIDKILEEMKND